MKQKLQLLTKNNSPFLITLCFALLAIFPQSCKKNDLQTQSTLSQSIITNKFFNLPAGTNTTVARVAAELQRLNQKNDLVTNLATQAGFPVWDKSTIRLLKDDTQNSNSLLEDYESGDTCILIPMVLQDAKFVNAFISATITDDNITLRQFYRNDYKAYPFKTAQTTTTNVTLAEDFAAQMMQFDKDVFRYNYFEVKDKRLFNNSTNYADTGKITRRVSLVDTSGGNSLLSCITIETTWHICTTPSHPDCTPNCDLCGYPICYESVQTQQYCTSGGPSGGGNAPGGSGGWPSAPPTGGGGGGPTGGGNPTGCLVGGLITEGVAAPNPCNPPTGGNPLPPLSGNLVWLKNNLPLDASQVSWLLERPSRTREMFDYLELETTPQRKQIDKDHLNLMRANNAYLAFVENHAITGDSTKMWWDDDLWLDNPTNFNLDITRANNQYDKLTAAEKILVKRYPTQAYAIKQNIDPAFAMSTERMGATGGLNDKKDAFRHAFFNAINTRDVGRDPLTLENIAKLFSDAHETEVPSQLQKEKDMDLWNNAVGHLIGNVWFPIFTTNSSLANDVYNKLTNGELRYIHPLNFTSSPYYDANNDGVQDCPTCLNGMLSTSILKPTNQ